MEVVRKVSDSSLIGATVAYASEEEQMPRSFATFLMVATWNMNTAEELVSCALLCKLYYEAIASGKPFDANYLRSVQFMEKLQSGSFDITMAQRAMAAATKVALARRFAEGVTVVGNADRAAERLRDMDAYIDQWGENAFEIVESGSTNVSNPSPAAAVMSGTEAKASDMNL